MLIIPYDAEQCINFYQELQKKVTEFIKRLLGKRKLSLWEGEPVLAEILDTDKVISRIAYYYANPSAANLVESIDEYPGLSSWKDFLTVEPSLNASITEDVPWIRLPTINKLHSLSPSRKEDDALCRKLIGASKRSHDLTIYPNAWMGAFNITSPEEVAEVNARVIAETRHLEEEARVGRKSAKRGVMGVVALLRQRIMAPHNPPPRERRIYVLSSVKELRADFIAAMKNFCNRCAACYRSWKNGDCSIPWPPGALRPGLRPIANATADISIIVGEYL